MKESFQTIKRMNAERVGTGAVVARTVWGDARGGKRCKGNMTVGEGEGRICRICGMRVGGNERRWNGYVE